MNSILKILKNTEDYLKLFIENFFVYAQELVDCNFDFFRSQKQFIISTTQGNTLKKKNPLACYILSNITFRKALKYSKKDSSNIYFEKLQLILKECVEEVDDVIKLKDEFAQYLDTNYNESHGHYLRISLIRQHIADIMSVHQTESGSDDQEEDNEDNENNEDNEDNKNNTNDCEDNPECQPNNASEDTKPSQPFGLDDDFIQNSAIGKLAAEISANIDADSLGNPEDLMRSFMESR